MNQPHNLASTPQRAHAVETGRTAGCGDRLAAVGPGLGKDGCIESEPRGCHWPQGRQDGG